jgi:hypothetical protein
MALASLLPPAALPPQTNLQRSYPISTQETNNNNNNNKTTSTHTDVGEKVHDFVAVRQCLSSGIPLHTGGGHLPSGLGNLTMRLSTPTQPSDMQVNQ